MGARSFALALVASSFVTACKPEFAERASFVDRPRVLAIRAEPPEVHPGDETHLEIFVVSTADDAKDNANWSLCRDPKPPTENNVVTDACLDRNAPSVASGRSAKVVVPKDACAIYGSEIPLGEFRPREPDETGGYFQPIRADVGSLQTVWLERIRCAPANTPVDVAKEYGQRYQPNKNPVLRSIRATVGDRDVSFNELPANQDIVLHAEWTVEDAESYAWIDPAALRVVDRREAMVVSWFSNIGEFASDRTGRSEGDTATESINVLRGLAGEKTVLDQPFLRIWVVLRDSRGGSDYREIEGRVLR